MEIQPRMSRLRFPAVVDIDYNLHPAGLAAAGLLPGSTCICTLWFIKLQSSMKTTATETFIFPLNFPNFLELNLIFLVLSCCNIKQFGFIFSDSNQIKKTWKRDTIWS